MEMGMRAVVEDLEGRMLLAGNVTAEVVGGILTIVGDRRGNNLTIDDQGLAAGQLRLSGDDTTINGEFGPVELSGITQDIRIFLGEGKNTLQVRGINAARGVEIFSGEAADYILIDSSTIAGDLLVRTRGGKDGVNLVETSVNGSGRIRTDTEADVVTLSGGVFAKKVLIQSGGGNDTVFHDATFSKGKQIVGGPGNDLVGDDSVMREFDFRNGLQGWSGAFADIFANPDVSQELEWGMRPLPASIGGGQGLFITSLNSTDDTFMYLTRMLGRADGLAGRATYQVRFEIRLASDAPSNCSGIGGAPGESVLLKAGATPIRPQNTTDEEGIERLNVDHGQQGSGGKAASLIGNIANGQDCPPNPTYVSLQRRHIHTALVKTDAHGNMHLIVGTDSGFEGTTALYYQSIGVRLIRVAT